jgi:hypothetical protein
VNPCCYWGVGNVGNAFTDAEGGFDKIWFGDYYKKLREKRTGPACATCNILRIFDDITIHFSPYLKSQPLFVEKLANFQEMTTSEGLRLNNDFDRAGLDMALHRWTLRNSIGDFKCLLDVRIDDADPLGLSKTRSGSISVKAMYQPRRRFRLIYPAASSGLAGDWRGEISIVSRGAGWADTEVMHRFSFVCDQVPPIVQNSWSIARSRPEPLRISRLRSTALKLVFGASIRETAATSFHASYLLTSCKQPTVMLGFRSLPAIRIN